MKGFRKNSFTLASIGLLLGAGAGVTTLDGCGENGICGPCGSVLEGSVSISGNAQLDGFFSAVADINGITASVKADFDANIRALAEVWGVAEATGEIDADYVAMLMGEIRGEIMASVEGGITLEYAPPQCSANVSVAVEAQASCEAQADCEVEATPGEISVECSGTCSGGCSGTCSGAVSCKVEGGVSCEGSCEGTCELMAEASCEGTCRGSCSGNCSVTNASGECQGSCDGMCGGTCEVQAGASCSGMCHGSCVTEAPSAECMATAECRGSCDGECSGGCEGSATPPSASASCEASADCQASASAQAEANIECTPPSLELKFAFNAAIAGDAGAEAAFLAKIGELKVRGAAILQGFAQMGAIINGRVNGEVVFEPAPLVNLGAQFQGVISAAASGDFDIAVGRIDCVVPALREAAEVLGSLAGETSGTIAAQAEFSTSVLSLGG